MSAFQSSTQCVGKARDTQHWLPSVGKALKHSFQITFHSNLTVKMSSPLNVRNSYDPNHIIDNTQDIRSLDDVLREINTSDSFGDKSDSKTMTKTKDKKTKLKQTGRSMKTSMTSDGDSGVDNGGQRYSRVFQVIYGVHKPYRKHKQFTCDGFLAVSVDGKHHHLFDINGNRVSGGKGLASVDQYMIGNNLVVGSQELEINDQICAQLFESGRFFETIDN